MNKDDAGQQDAKSKSIDRARCYIFLAKLGQASKWWEATKQGLGYMSKLAKERQRLRKGGIGGC